MSFAAYGRQFNFQLAPNPAVQRAVPADRTDIEALRRWVAVVPQNTEIVAGTLAENIALYDPLLLERAADAVRELGIESWVDSLPDGIATRLGDGGYKLSAGQEQLVAFARILVRDPQVVILEAAVGATPGEARLLVSERTPTVTTLSADWVRRVGADPSFRGVSWSPGARVPVTTLDALAAAHGRPDFVKLDIEGSEAEALAGLSTPVAALSFEYLAAARDVALACVDRLAAALFRDFPGESGRTIRVR